MRRGIKFIGPRENNQVTKSIRIGYKVYKCVFIHREQGRILQIRHTFTAAVSMLKNITRIII